MAEPPMPQTTRPVGRDGGAGAAAPASPNTPERPECATAYPAVSCLGRPAMAPSMSPRSSSATRAAPRSVKPATSALADHAEDEVALLLHELPRVGAEIEPQQRLRVGGPHVEVPAFVVDGDAVELGDLAVGEPRLEASQRRADIAHRGVDLAADEVLGAQRLEQLGHGGAFLREQLEDQQRGDEAGIRVVVVAEVVVPGDLAAEQHRLAAHALLEEGVPDAVEQRHAACLLYTSPSPRD